MVVLPASGLDLTTAILEMESGARHGAIGDHGRAHGGWQLWRGAWRDVSTQRQQRHEPVWSYAYAHDPAVSRLYASDYVLILQRRLTLELHRPVTPGELYAAWRLGVEGFKRRHFELAQCSPDVRDSVQRLGRLLTLP